MNIYLTLFYYRGQRTIYFFTCSEIFNECFVKFLLQNCFISVDKHNKYFIIKQIIHNLFDVFVR